ncbi:hypothetical protein AB0873_09775 [Micromonospora sp. NPDC047707]|uniref:hypothetical protein n=1 Tax=Micromonospora sp. NPDC047707 TaxID=3154498 RepID=UPI00345503AF
MNVRHLLVAAAAALLGGFGSAAPAAAHVSTQPFAASVDSMSAGRLGASVAAVLGLAGLVIGGLDPPVGSAPAPGGSEPPWPWWRG